MKVLAAGLLALAAVAPVQGSTIVDFSPLNGEFTFVGPTYVESGFSFTNSLGTTDSLFSWGSAYSNFSADPMFDTLNNNYGGTTTTVQRVAGDTFRLGSIDLADVYNAAAGGDVLFTFNTAAGSTSQTVSLAPTTGFKTFTFNRNDLQSFSYLPLTTAGAWIQADNFVFGAAVPEAATWAMLITGFGLTGAIMRRRRTVVAA